VGGGIGGMATAIRLAEQGVAVDLIDLDPDWRVYGAGHHHHRANIARLCRLGLIEAIKAAGAITNRSRIYRFDGMLLRDLEEPAIEEGLPATAGSCGPICTASCRSESAR
jgi:2-polyprenyl-6-methoxyphenol hydroxylase-like FAD-dependent oxidoreductase